MKVLKFLLVGLSLFNIQSLLGQQIIDSLDCLPQIDTLTKMEIYSIVSTFPEVECGAKELLKELSDIQLDEFKEELPTKIILAFIIDIDGKVIGERIIQDGGIKKYAVKALDLVKNKKWTSGKCNGKNVPVIIIIPLRLEIG